MIIRCLDPWGSLPQGSSSFRFRVDGSALVWLSVWLSVRGFLTVGNRGLGFTLRVQVSL